MRGRGEGEEEVTYRTKETGGKELIREIKCIDQAYRHLFRNASGMGHLHMPDPEGDDLQSSGAHLDSNSLIPEQPS